MRDRFRLIRFSRFWRDQGGASAVEFALIAPLLFALLLGIIQYGSLFFIEARMTDTARDTARRLAVGDLATEHEAAVYAAGRLAQWSNSFSATAKLPVPPDHDVEVSLSVPKREVAWINLVGIGMDGDLHAEFHMLKE